MRRTIALIVSLVVLSLACSLTGMRPTATPAATPGPVPNNTVDVRPTATPLITPIVEIPGPTDTPVPTATGVSNPNTPLEAIVILSPGRGSQVTSPFTVSGMADSVFENTLLIQVIGANGQTVGVGNASLHADVGQRGPFEGTATFTAPAQPEPGRILVSVSSPRDGHLVHLASVEVTLLPRSSSAVLATDSEQPEVLQIQSPAPHAVIQGGLLHLAGFGGPAFEQTLNVNIYDENNQRVGGGPVTIRADAGGAGTFAIDLPYTVAQSQAGYVEVYMDSPRDGGSTHVSTVDVTLEP